MNTSIEMELYNNICKLSLIHHFEFQTRNDTCRSDARNLNSIFIMDLRIMEFGIMHTLDNNYYTCIKYILYAEHEL